MKYFVILILVLIGFTLSLHASLKRMDYPASGQIFEEQSAVSSPVTSHPGAAETHPVPARKEKAALLF